MRIVLPPSETKQAGGVAGSSLEWAGMVLPEITPTREAIASDLVNLSLSTGAREALGLGARSADWLEANQTLYSSPVMPAIERYTGVVFDALGYGSMSETSRQRVAECVWLFSALFGPILATDLIPRYRLSFDSRIPGESLKTRWLRHTGIFWANDFTLDLRSEGYRALSPLTEGSGVFIRLVKDLKGGVAAGHQNKITKGKFVRAIIDSGARFRSEDNVLSWAEPHGFEMMPQTDAPGELLLVVVD